LVTRTCNFYIFFLISRIGARILQRGTERKGGDAILIIHVRSREYAPCMNNAQRVCLEPGARGYESRNRMRTRDGKEAFSLNRAHTHPCFATIL
jgi:hypothetical protein